MRKLILFISVLVLLSGCAFIKSQKENWDACKSNPQCMEDARRWQESGEMVGGIAGSVVPGAAMPAQKGLGYAAFAIAMLLGGHALNKKKDSK